MIANHQHLLEAYVREHGERSWRLAVALMGDPADAEDVVQDALLTLARLIERAPADRPWPRLATIVCNSARNARRVRARRRRVGTLGEDWDVEDRGSDRPLDAAIRRELAVLIRQEVAGLAEDERDALVVTHVAGLSQAEAAQTLGIPLGTVKTRVRRGIDRLRSRLHRHLDAVEATESEAFGSSDGRDVALARCLGAAVIAVPAGGFEAAKAGWIASASMGLPSIEAVGVVVAGASGAGALPTAVATGAVMMTSKTVFFGAIAGALVLGLSAGAFGLGPVLAGEDPPVRGAQYPSAGANADAGGGADVRAGRLADAEREAAKLRLELERERGLVAAHRADLERLGQVSGGYEAELKAKDAEIAGLRTGIEELSRSVAKADEVEANTGGEDAGATRAKARGLLGELLSMLDQGKGKNEVAAKLAELRKLGVDAADEVYEAYMAVARLGSPYGGENKLNWSTVEFNGLLTWEFVEHAVGAGASSAPAPIKEHALQWHASDPRIPPERRLAVIGEELDRGNPATVGTAVECLERLNTPDANPYLQRAAANSSLDESSRVRALITLGRHQRPADAEAVARIAADGQAPEAVRDAAHAARMMNAPETSGFLVTWVTAGSPAARGGLRVGDIVTRVNGAVITDVASIRAAYTPSENAVSVVVSRRGEAVTLSIVFDGKTASGFSGRSVVTGATR